MGAVRSIVWTKKKRMNKQEYLLTRLAEECAEVIKVVTKIQSYGLRNVNPKNPVKPNKSLLEDELVDLMTVMNILQFEEIITLPSDQDMITAMEMKEAKIEKWMVYSREQGCLQDESQHTDK